jgi:uncharacterized protein YfaS (alpha-2-macroglobulin family)
VLEMVEKREQAPRLPVMALLEPEVRELADARVYLDHENPKAALATDLLLGTQGWRRFALVNSDEFLTRHGDDALRVLAVVKPNPPAPAAMAFAVGGGFGGGGGVAQIHPAELKLAREVDDVPLDAAQREALEDRHLRDGLDRGAAVPDAAPKQLAADDMLVPAVGGGGAGGRGGRAMAANRRLVIRPVAVRVYAHDLRPNWSPTDRSDFTETVYWNACIKTDEAGHATAGFALSDSVTTFRIYADGFDRTGALGTITSTLQSVQPFYIEPKMPLEVTEGDLIELPVAAVNNTPNLLGKLAVSCDVPAGMTVKPMGDSASSLAADQRARRLFTIGVKEPVEGDLAISATAGGFTDRVTRKLRVRPAGFPTQIAAGGLLNPDSTVKKEFVVPASLVPRSMETAITVYSSPMASLTDAVAALLREPNGCFEQTSSSNYPLAMAQMYFLSHQGVDPRLIAQSGELLSKGYARLIGFECKDKGYEWFGTGPGHEALTAYGLMEFHDMQQAKVAIVDPRMVERTRAWLLARRDGKGGFERNAKSVDSFGGAPELTTNAYIVWALQQSGEKGLHREIAAVREAAGASDDSYVVALAANICAADGDAQTARKLMEKLARRQNKAGAVEGALTSITRSGGEALAIEATALASLAWMRDPGFAANTQNAARFLADSCKGGRFGSTQSTILALKAITAIDQSQAHPLVPGEVVLLVDGRPLGDPVKFTADTKEPLRFADVSSSLTPGEHSLALQMNGGSPMPFSIAVNFNSTTPSSDKECKLDLSTWLKDAQIAEGGITESRVVVTNKTDTDAASPIAIVGIPGGLEVRHEQLKELVKSGKVDAYEVNGREVVLYWRQLKAHARADLSLSLTAAVPGSYAAPASRVYEYYTDEFKQWAEGPSIRITPQ